MTKGIEYALDLIDKTFGVNIRKAKSATAGLDFAVGRANSNIATIEVTGRKSFGGIGRYAKRAAIGIAAMLSVQQAVAFGNQITGLEAKFEGYENAIRFASGAAATKNFQFLDNQIDKLNLNVDSSYKGFKTLAASLKGTQLEGQSTRDIFEAVSIASTTMGLSADQSEGAFLALSQMASKGKVQAEELRGQLGERIPGALKIAADAMGVNQQQFNKMLDAGNVYAEDFLPKFAKQLKSTFQGGLAVASNSMQASINRMNNSVISFKRNTAQLFRPLIINVQNTIPKILKYIESLLPKLFTLKDSALQIWEAFSPLKAVFNDIGNEIGGTAGVIDIIRGIMEKTAVVVNVMSTGIATLYEFTKPLHSTIKGLAIVFGILNVIMAMNPVLAIVLGITALVGVIALAYKKVDWFRGGIKATWEIIKGFGMAIKMAVVDRFMELIRGITGVASAIKHLFDGEFTKAAEVGKKAIGNVFGVETKQNLIAHARDTAKKAGTAYRVGLWEASKNSKVAVPKISKSPLSNIDKQIRSKGIFSAPFSSNNVNKEETKIASNNKNKITTSVSAAKGTKQLTVTIDKFVENLSITMDKGKNTSNDIKRVIEEVFLEMTADLEKRLVNV